MRNLFLASAVLAICTPAFSQGFSAPLGYESTEAGYYSNYLGAYPYQKFQIVHGDWADGNARSGKALHLRRDRSYVTSTSYGRSWTNVLLRMCEGPLDYATTSTTFTANYLTTPTAVFSASVSWPQAGGAAAPGTLKNPTTWGKMVKDGELTFPFNTTFMHSGKGGVLADFEFQGGKMANGATWTGYSPYYHDGRDGSSQGGLTWLYGKSTCQATGRTTYNYYIPYMYTRGGTHSKSGNHEFYFRYYGLPANATMVGVISLFGKTSANTTIFPTSCNPLHLDLTKPFDAFLFTGDSDGAGYLPFPSYLSTPYIPSAVGSAMWSQAAYDDGTPKTLQLTMAGRAEVWEMPPKTVTGARLYRGQSSSTPPWTTGSKYNSRVPVFYIN